MCVGGTCALSSQERAGGGANGSTDAKQTPSSLCSSPCHLPPALCPGLGRLLLCRTHSWKYPTRTLIALRWPSARERVHRRGQQSSSAATRSPSRVLCSPHNYVGCVTVSVTPGDQRPWPGRLIRHLERSCPGLCDATINSASHSPQRGLSPGPLRLRMLPPGLNILCSWRQTQRSLGRKE